MITIMDIFTKNERAFTSQQPVRNRKAMGKILAKGASMKRDLSQGFGGPEEHYQRSFERLALKKAGYKSNARYMAAKTAKKLVKLKVQRAA